MEDKIREAYEEMSPTPEQEARMLAALQEAQAARDERDAQLAEHGQDTPTGGDFAPKPAPQRKRFSAWKIAAPLAACLVLGAVAVGMGALGSAPSAQAPVATEAVHEQSSVESTAASPSATAKEPATAADSNSRESADATQLYGSSGDSYMTLETEEVGAIDGLAYTDSAVEEPYPGIIGDPGFNTEEYAAIDENGFVATRTSPLSTVSADVDTASYANVRRMINDGYTLDSIPEGAVRVEEMLNYFTYDYDKPTGDELFSMQAQASTCPWNADTQLLVLGFSTPEETEAAQKGANLVFLIDVSGSMRSDDKLPLLQDSFTTLLDHLDGNDRVSIVTYSGEEEVVLDGAPGDEDAQILKAIYQLRAEGSTNGEAGLRMAYDIAEKNFIEGGVNRIIMASDGDLNVGMTSESDLYDLVDGKRETGVYLSVLGFGSGNYKDTKMEVLADHGNGSYHYIDCIDEAERVLSERLMANLVPFADDVKVQVEFNPDQVKAYRLIGYENRALAAEDFLDDAVDAGDVGPNAQFTVAYEIVPVDSAYEVNVPDLKYGSTESSSSDSPEWLTCSLRYRAFADDAIHEQSLVVGNEDETARPDDDWCFASAVIQFGMLASGSDYVGSASIDGVLETLDGMRLTPERQGFYNLVQKAR